VKDRAKQSSSSWYQSPRLITMLGKVVVKLIADILDERYETRLLLFFMSTSGKSNQSTWKAPCLTSLSEPGIDRLAHVGSIALPASGSSLLRVLPDPLNLSLTESRYDTMFRVRSSRSDREN
jgi:hypothetical protein